MRLSFPCYYSHSLGLVSARHGNMCLQISGQGQWRQVHFWGSLTSQPTGIRKIQASGRPISKQRTTPKVVLQPPQIYPRPHTLTPPCCPPTYAPIHVHTCENGLEKYKNNTYFNWKTQREKEMRMRGKKKKICLMYNHTQYSITNWIGFLGTEHGALRIQGKNSTDWVIYQVITKKRKKPNHFHAQM